MIELVKGDNSMDTKDAQLMEITVDEQFLKNYQAIYYAMNAKPDCRSKLFSKNVIISLQDLKNLNRKVTDKFKAHYDNAGFRINVNVSLKNKEYLEFDSWATFENYDFNIEQSISSILIVWEYNAKLPSYPLPQRHTLSVRIADEIRAEEMLNLVVSGKLEEVDKLEQEVCPIVARVDFINAILGDELLRIVEQWQDGLLISEKEYSKGYSFVKKYSRVFAYAINYITTFVIIMCMMEIIHNILLGFNIDLVSQMKIGDLSILIWSAVICTVVCMFVYKISMIVANIVFTTLRADEEGHIFNITNGDQNLMQKLQFEQKNRKKRVALNIILTLLFNVICSVLANCIS